MPDRAPADNAFADKAAARRAVWDRLQAARAARFPYPPHGRIPNFAGAEAAARALFDHEPWATAHAVKVNPDAPQRPVRLEALERGIVVCVPTPRLRGGFKRFDPARIPPDQLARAASLSKGDAFAESLALADLPRFDALVTGSVAVTRGGRRCGKGHGFADLEYAVLRELGHPPAPVATTVHDLQIIDTFPAGRLDLPIHSVITPTQAFTIDPPPADPGGIAWDALSAADMAAMPVLAELAARTHGAIS